MSGSVRLPARSNRVLLLAGVVLLVVSAVLQAWSAVDRDMTRLEAALLQSVSIVLAAAASYVIASFSFRQSLHDALRLYSGPAMRRVFSIAVGLRGTVQVLQDRRAGLGEGGRRSVPNSEVALMLDAAENMLRAQIQAAVDAIEDWKDLVPEEFAKIEEQLEVPGGSNQ